MRLFPRSLATAVGISVAAHAALYVLTPVLSLHLVALGGTSTQAGLLFSVFSLVAVVLRPAAGAWIDRRGVQWALFPGAAIVVLASLGIQTAAKPAVLITLMAAIGVGVRPGDDGGGGARGERAARATGGSAQHLLHGDASGDGSGHPLALTLFRSVGVAANFALATALALAAAIFGLRGREVAPPSSVACD